MNLAQNTLIIERSTTVGQEFATWIGKSDIYSPSIVTTSVCGIIEELRQNQCIKRIVFSPEILHTSRWEKWSPEALAIYGKAIIDCWERTDMPHLFFHILWQLRPDLRQKGSPFFWPVHLLCDTDASNAESDTILAAQEFHGIQVHTRSNMLKQLNIDTKTPNYRAEVGKNFASLN